MSDPEPVSGDPRRRAMWRVEKARQPFPAAIAYHGSVWQRMFWGVTRGHAVRRAWRWIEGLS